MPLSKRDLLKTIDHTNLNPDATQEQIDQLCEEAIRYGFGAVCVAPSRVGQAARNLASAGSSAIAVASVVGFPHGNTLTEVKEFETAKAIERGASEVDMVMAIGQFESNDYETVYSDIAGVVRVAERHETTVKVIIESYLLSEEAKIRKACKIAKEAGADYVKSSTGFLTAEKLDPESKSRKLLAIEIMRKEVGLDIGVKAAGGISNLSDALEFLEAGASRLGCSSSVAIANELGARP